MPDPVLGEFVGDALVLHTAADARDAVLPALARLPPAPQLSTVVTAPSVTRRPDLGEVLPATILAYLFDARDGIRWLPVGQFAGDAPTLDVLGLDVVLADPSPEARTPADTSPEAGTPVATEPAPVSPEVITLLTTVRLPRITEEYGQEPVDLAAPPGPVPTATGTPDSAEPRPGPVAGAGPPRVPDPVPAPAAAAPTAGAAGGAQAPVTRWVAVRPALDGDDRRALRTVLAGRYDAHARLVARTLAEQPGLRAGADTAALVPGLVAVRAYATGDRRPVNMYLRTAEGDDSPSRDLLARSVAFGLHRLPATIGPVFAVHAARAPVGYRPGDELTEPGFVDAGLAPGPLDGRAGVEYAIWSVSARRLGGLGSTAGAALFPPGARFSVLAVDPPDGDGQPARVLLRELIVARAGRGSSADPSDRMLSRLRTAARTGAGPVTLDFTVGLDAAGRRYAPTPTARPATAHPVRTTRREGG